MKTKKLNLTDLKVKSFVTEFDQVENNTLKGGSIRNQSLDTNICTFMPCLPLASGGQSGCSDNE